MSIEPRRGLGRGLSALLGDVSRDDSSVAGSRENGQLLPIAAIQSDPAQPRRHFDEAGLEELAGSIRARGLLQPILVRPLPTGNGYQIVAGERRWRAAQRAQLREIPAIVRELDDAATLEIALVENIQRQDLNAIEEAEAYRRLIADYGHTQEALGQLVHKSRSHVANLIRLLDLPAPVQAMVGDGVLTMGHARAMIGASDPEGLAREVVRRGLSVREAETLARGTKPAAVPARRKPPSAAGSANEDVAALERQLGDMLGLRVTIGHTETGGTVVISYATFDQLDIICQRLSGEPI